MLKTAVGLAVACVLLSTAAAFLVDYRLGMLVVAGWCGIGVYILPIDEE